MHEEEQVSQSMCVESQRTKGKRQRRVKTTNGKDERKKTEDKEHGTRTDDNITVYIENTQYIKESSHRPKRKKMSGTIGNHRPSLKTLEHFFSFLLSVCIFFFYFSFAMSLCVSTVSSYRYIDDASSTPIAYGLSHRFRETASIQVYIADSTRPFSLYIFFTRHHKRSIAIGSSIYLSIEEAFWLRCPAKRQGHQKVCLCVNNRQTDGGTQQKKGFFTLENKSNRSRVYYYTY